MPRLGAHTSVAGGLYRAFERIVELEGEAMQVFSRNERRWHSPALSPEDVERFEAAWRRAGGIPVAAHDSYLINLSTPDPQILERSVQGFADELRRTSLLKIDYLVTHPGSHRGLGPEEGLKRFVRNMDRAIDLAGNPTVTILIETTAGQGTNLGSRFEEVAFILTTSRYGASLGVCLDTCHVFAAGYELRSPDAYAETMARFDTAVGIERIKFFHLNDSKKPLGSRVDRHEHIGRGKLGLEPFRLLLNDPRFRTHPMVLETPKGKDLVEDKENLALLRSLIDSGIPARAPAPQPAPHGP